MRARELLGDGEGRIERTSTSNADANMMHACHALSVVACDEVVFDGVVVVVE